MDDLDHSPTAQAVYQRTGLGQIEVLARRIPLSPLERRLLQMVTGHTQLGDLLTLLGEALIPAQAVTSLRDKGLIRCVSGAAQGHWAPPFTHDWVRLFGPSRPWVRTPFAWDAAPSAPHESWPA